MIKLGIVTPAYITQERHDISLSWVYSMQRAAEYIPAGMTVKHVIIDDCSPAGQDVFEAYHRGVYLITRFYKEVITNTLRRGKWALSENFVDGIRQLSDYDYIISIPDDVLVNKYIFKVIKKSIELLNDDIRFITFFKDIRRCIWGDKENDGKKYNDYFNVAKSCDGFLLLARTADYEKMIKVVDRKDAASQGSTLVWRNANRYMSGYKVLEYNESLAQHIGNSFSAMVGAPRNKERYIYAKDVNLFVIPKILGGKK